MASIGETQTDEVPKAPVVAARASRARTINRLSQSTAQSLEAHNPQDNPEIGPTAILKEASATADEYWPTFN